MRIFEKCSGTPSVQIAKDRLKALLVTDRVECEPDTYELLCNELYRTVSKYIKVDEKYFDVEVTRSNIFIKLVGEES